MSAAHKANLDIDELMHLALRAVNGNQDDLAIDYLKQVIERDPSNGLAYYLLGAVHAGLGMYDRAAEEMTKAIHVDPNVPPTAYFQLGLLQLTLGRIAEAEEVWQALDNRGEDDFLFLFKRGMLHLVADEFEACVHDLQRGIELNDFNEKLNVDMRKFVAKAQAAMAHSQGAGERGQRSGETEKNAPKSGRVLSAYEPDEHE